MFKKIIQEQACLKKNYTYIHMKKKTIKKEERKENSGPQSGSNTEETLNVYKYTSENNGAAVRHQGDNMS